jgi:hypothetical protein
MARNFALPFKTALPADLTLGDWHYEREPGLPVRIGESIAGWDYLKEFRLQREVAFEYGRILAACGLDAKNEISLVATAHSPTARYREVCYRSDPLSARRKSESIACRIDGAVLASELILTTELILTKASGVRKPFLAHLHGSRLYSESITIELEGASSRMPMEIVRFSEQLAWLNAPRAAWFVSCGTADLHAPIMRELRVYLNSDEPGFADAARRADLLLVSLIGADTSRQILRAALNDAEFVSGSRDYDEGTLGETAVRLLSLCFGDQRAAVVKALADRDAGKFDAAIQSAMNVTPNA